MFYKFHYKYYTTPW